ncbi:universal stress protein [Vreelandella rituensis]|uniref:Universal stress protein n=1 Tax=Vreelandella rituensis TaxID=2282306 RepID=A0A368TYI0_9GAMM|nr:universal stress protein [Halomonas rituensis]RCV89287.1 universal stress protein [Halomonas rituensis]
MSEHVSLVIAPVDGSPEAAAAAHHAGLLSQLLDAQLQLVHVMPLNPPELSDLPANRKAELDHDRAQRKQAAAAAFAEARKALHDEAPTPEEVVLEESSFVRHPERVIIDHARDQSRALLVMGARQLSDMGKWVRGSVSNAVVHQARGPVTILHTDADVLNKARIKRILVPVDGSSHSDMAARLAGDMARSGRLPVELLFCRPPREVPLRDDGEPEEMRVFARSRKALGEVPAGVTQTLLENEHYARAIVAHARHCNDSPVIIMGRRGLGKWRESLLGSVSHDVIDDAPCAVTVVSCDKGVVRRPRRRP